jgi:hypothetical protein
MFSTAAGVSLDMMTDCSFSDALGDVEVYNNPI